MNVIPFMKWRRFAAAFSLIAMLVAAGSLGTRSLNWGLDFTGGTLVEVTYGDSADLSLIRATLESNGYEGAVVVAFGTDRDVLVRLPLGYSDDEGVAMVTLLESVSAVPVELQRIEFVGPAVGEELREQGGLAMLLALGLVMFVLGYFSLLGMEFDLTVLAAILAVIGYSLNDTIVVADRIRENFRKLRRMSPSDVIDVSLTETFGRTVVTSLTTILVLVALAVFGGDMIHGFALALLAGVAIGTYSSIYVSATILLALGVSKEDVAIPTRELGNEDGSQV
ncbi:MAG: protein translocase subunit SecF [Cellvibrionales bacterium]|nr:protein translocase subunit SecF [Cellvibrionales bacterium]